jgi:glycosyltransferase involved in cell wall biosynthesis
MRILLIAYYFPPLPGPGSLRPARMAAYLKSRGHEVFVLTQGNRAAAGGETSVRRVPDISCNCDRRGWRRARWLALRLAVEALNWAGVYASIYSFWKRAVLRREEAIMASLAPQAIVATYPPVETLEIGLRLSRKYRLPWIADFRDGLLFEPVESKRLGRFACVRRAYSEIERQVAAEATALVTVSEPLSEHFRRTYGRDRVLTVANGFDPEESAMALPEIELEDNCFHIVHSGRFALSDAGCDIAPLVAALSGLLADRPELARTVRLHLLGELSRREMKSLAGLRRGGVVRAYGAVARGRALAFQRQADLLLLVTSPERSSVATTKLFEYLQARRPILALAPRSFAAEIIEKCRCGWVVPPLAAKEIREVLERLILDPDLDRKVDLSLAAIGAYSFPAGLARLNELLRDMNGPCA